MAAATPSPVERIKAARPDATIGPQPERIGDTRIWTLPSPSGLNAHYQLEDLAAQFAALKEAVDAGL